MIITKIKATAIIAIHQARASKISYPTGMFANKLRIAKPFSAICFSVLVKSSERE
jgi:hypothetical protein